MTLPSCQEFGSFFFFNFKQLTFAAAFFLFASVNPVLAAVTKHVKDGLNWVVCTQ